MESFEKLQKQNNILVEDKITTINEIKIAYNTII